MTKKRIPLKRIAEELSESDLDGMIRMGLEIELKTQNEMVPMLIEILSHFRCERCGECCRNAPATVSDDELVAIAKITGSEAFDALDENKLTNVFKAPCRFLSEKCRIYDIRPMVCRVYPLSVKNFGFVTLILCPMGKEIQKELENFVRSKGVKEVRYQHDENMQKVEDNLNDLREMAGYEKDNRTLMQVGLRYGYIPMFLKYLRGKKA